jgi:hypothetical protein
MNPMHTVRFPMLQLSASTRLTYIFISPGDIDLGHLVMIQRAYTYEA